MLDLDRVERYMGRLSIRDRDTGSRIPFVLREQQKRIMHRCKEHMEKGNRLYVIFLKARRVGISTWASAIQLAHCAARSDAHAAIIAQTLETSKELFNQATGFISDLRPINPLIEVKNKTLIYPHQGALSSDLRHYTAATVHGTRGLTFSSIHMTEAAFYPFDGAYTAILNTLSSDPDNICLIETTANGMEGPGEAYYEYWQAAEAGDSEFLSIFLPWWEDPAYVRDPAEAEDAPASDYEKWLMNDVMDTSTGKKAVIGKDRIAWFRMTMQDKCEGNIDRWRAEFPATPEEAFIATGSPAFSQEESQFAIASRSDPIHYGDLEIDPITKKPSFIPRSQPNEEALLIWEFPQPHAHYFFGVDTARGEMNKTPGDFAAIVGWNAETGMMCARYAARVSPETLAGIANLIGRFYNDACLNVEINNLGYVVMRDLRDRHYYPTQYRWKGRDDKYDGKSATALGFETTDRYRKMMFNIFRTSLYRKEVTPRDKTFINQMLAAKMEMGWRWDIAVGHDDIFMAGLLGWIAKEQYHPMICKGTKSRNLLLSPDELAAAQIALTGRAEGVSSLSQFGIDPTTTAFGALMQNANDHLRMLKRYEGKQKAPQRLAGL